LKRFALLATFAFALLAAFALSSPGAHARPKAGAVSPSPSPSAALPVATPEPPEIAIPRLQGLLKVNPNDAAAMTQLAMQYLQINRPDLAVGLTQHLIKTGNKSAQIYYFDGAALLALGQTDAATADFEHASTLDPTNLGVLAQLTSVYLRENRSNDAERVAKRAVTFNKNSSQAYLNLGIVYANEGHFDDARVQFEQAATMDPKDTEPIVQITNTYASQNNIPMALTTIDRALAIDPKNVQVLVYKADLYGKQHDDAHVAPAYDDAVVAATTDEERVEILIRKAGYYSDSKKNDVAMQTLTQAVTTYPKVAAGHVALGDLYAQNKQISQAELQWQAALADDKNFGPALLRMGQDRLGSRKWDDAIGYLKHYTEVDPQDAQGYASLGQAYSFVHDYARSRQACQQSFGIQRTPETLACVGGADFELKNYKEGSQIFDALIVNANGFLQQNPTMLYVAAECWAKTNQKPKAISALKALLMIVKKGSPEYKSLSTEIASLSAPASKKKKT
jgi:tetratricopeptide (TPR) repeat protein